RRRRNWSARARCGSAGWEHLDPWKESAQSMWKKRKRLKKSLPKKRSKDAARDCHHRMHRGPKGRQVSIPLHHHAEQEIANGEARAEKIQSFLEASHRSSGNQ